MHFIYWESYHIRPSILVRGGTQLVAIQIFSKPITQLWIITEPKYSRSWIACPSPLTENYFGKVKKDFKHLICQVYVKCLFLLPKASFGRWVLSLPAYVCVSVCRQSQACLCDNLSTVSARITKFGPDMETPLVKFRIVLWGDWPWPSRPKWP